MPSPKLIEMVLRALAGAGRGAKLAGALREAPRLARMLPGRGGRALPGLAGTAMDMGAAPRVVRGPVGTAADTGPLFMPTARKRPPQPGPGIMGTYDVSAELPELRMAGEGLPAYPGRTPARGLVKELSDAELAELAGEAYRASEASAARPVGDVSYREGLRAVSGEEAAFRRLSEIQSEWMRRRGTGGLEPSLMGEGPPPRRMPSVSEYDTLDAAVLEGMDVSMGPGHWAMERPLTGLQIRPGKSKVLMTDGKMGEGLTHTDAAEAIRIDLSKEYPADRVVLVTPDYSARGELLAQGGIEAFTPGLRKRLLAIAKELDQDVVRVLPRRAGAFKVNNSPFYMSTKDFESTAKFRGAVKKAENAAASSSRKMPSIAEHDQIDARVMDDLEVSLTPRQRTAYQRQYYQQHKEKIAPTRRQYYQDRKEALTAYQRQYRQTHKEEIAAYQRAIPKETRAATQRRGYQKKLAADKRPAMSEYDQLDARVMDDLEVSMAPGRLRSAEKTIREAELPKMQKTLLSRAEKSSEKFQIAIAESGEPMTPYSIVLNDGTVIRSAKGLKTRVPHVDLVTKPRKGAALLSDVATQKRLDEVVDFMDSGGLRVAISSLENGSRVLYVQCQTMTDAQVRALAPYLKDFNMLILDGPHLSVELPNPTANILRAAAAEIEYRYARGLSELPEIGG